jgi:hypothetical protein
MTLNIEHTFDPSTYRHAVNGQEFVLHCHHYMALTTKLAVEQEERGGTRVLCESAEDAVFTVLSAYLDANSVEGGEARLAVGKEYFALMGLGRLEVTGGEQGGEVTLLRSHVDQAWVKKFGNADDPIGHFNRGYAAAMFRAAFKKPERAYKTTEAQSIAKGDERGTIKVELG